MRSGDQPVFRVVLIRAGDDEHRFVLTNHHIVMDGWSLPILVRELFASYDGQRLPAPVPYRRFVPGWPAGIVTPPARPGVRCWPVSTPPPWWAPPGRLRLGRRAVASFRVPEQTTRAVGELARSRHTTVNIVLQAAYAQLLMPVDRPADVVFGTAVSGRPAEVPGADSMVGLLINTVPVRAAITAATTTADLLAQLHRAHNHTLDHQHLALSDIHRVTGHEQLFDTLFLYENYPIDTTAALGVDGLAITEFSTPRIQPLPAGVASPARAPNWACASNTTPRYSRPPPSTP